MEFNSEQQQWSVNKNWIDYMIKKKGIMEINKISAATINHFKLKYVGWWIVKVTKQKLVYMADWKIISN